MAQKELDVFVLCVARVVASDVASAVASAVAMTTADA